MSRPMRIRMGDTRSRRRGFSLAELMIAFAVLAMGLLVIGAALPIGVRYAQESANLATGEAAAQYALDLVEQNVSLVRGSVLDGSDVDHQNTIFVPRYDLGDPFEGAFDPNYEPIIKVRPLYTQHINAKPGRPPYFTRNQIERVINDWLNVNDPKEYDLRYWMRPTLSWADVVYPPVTFTANGRDPYYPDDFNPSNPESEWPGQWAHLNGYARTALERTFSWTVFYRRVSYGPGSDPALYELIAVVTRLPTEEHRFPIQQASGTLRGLQNAATETRHVALAYNGNDTKAPLPWLVTFDRLPQPSRFVSPDGMPLDADDPPATLTFLCEEDDAALFVAGSLIIPARNDVEPDLVTSPQDLVRFGPNIGNSLPIYEVIDRPDERSVVVKYNGFYPRLGMQAVSDGNFGERWPVWVIPPAFSEMAGGEPLLEDKSPIVAVSRRFVRLREVP